MTALKTKRISEIRKARNLSRPKLAKLMGVTERQVSRLEGALPWKGEFTEDMLLRLATALQVTPEFLLGYEPVSLLSAAPIEHGKSCSCC